ncbi:MAG: hypothetical protein FP813_04690 [Desulfurivibrio sp.]|nr:hypothetical protein [Desulfurivibrio sp.]MBU3936513.1 hypothetical protein [Pseudomonadota bacterium]MBU4034674.1 hypothetical protein [Pseudomonadota bacterium]MBU4118230.1 hypothetical protein [Pseudomonadota bacterium]
MATLFFTVLLLLGCLLPDKALAFQPHAYSGLYIHQLAHFFLIVSLFFFAVKARQTRLAFLKGWRQIIAGTWVLMLWSTTTMVGHFLDFDISEDAIFLPPGATIPFLRLNGWQEALFYLLKFDHLLAVPAMFLFYRGLKLLREGQATPSSPRQTQP